MKKFMTFIVLSTAAVSICAQANEQQHQTHMNMPMSTDSAMQQELMQGMNQMHQDMMAAMQYQDPDVAFAAGMLPHHIGAVKMIPRCISLLRILLTLKKQKLNKCKNGLKCTIK